MFSTLLLYLIIGSAIIYAIIASFAVPYYIILASIAIILIAIWYVSPKLFSVATKLRYVGKDEYPQLQETISDLAVKSRIRPPRIAIVPAREPNLFVFGRSKRSATLAINEGLLSILSQNELKAALLHEFAHIRSGDYSVLTMISFVPMAFYMMAQKAFGPGIRENKRNDISYNAILGILAFIIYMLSEIPLLPLADAREYYADSVAVKIQGSGIPLSNALYKISYANSKTQNSSINSSCARPFYIIDFFNIDADMNELKNHYEAVKPLISDIDITTVLRNSNTARNGMLGMLNSLLYTHPRTYKRVLNIKSMKTV